MGKNVFYPPVGIAHITGKISDLVKYKLNGQQKIIINTFLITATIVAVLTLWNYYYLNSDMHHASNQIGKSFITKILECQHVIWWQM